ncbi:AAA family ATPase [Saccharothrix violaceirubra]|uniref:Uridine kinase n=1 Tax=Saccharothrix violaceirubra TaxID=413306 RepID=A0A7W7WXN1_9PSEU|nr:(d)CMP kinase [Saccharothrix violaceirubra]MBB4967261.1 uridine kinase [Saccharothrix violaceirubra]
MGTVEWLAAWAAQAGGRVVVGIDGPGAAGKSTLAAALAAELGAVVVHTDDFHLPSAERVGNGYDLARLRVEVFEPAAVGKTTRYRRYDWPDDRLADWVQLPGDVPLVVEGVYSTSSAVRGFCTTTVFCRASPEVRLSRGLARDGEAARSRWVDEWMPAEDRYFAAERVEEAADVVVLGEHGEFRVIQSRRPGGAS